jgi:hypothetical protein
METDGSKIFSETPHLSRNQLHDYVHHRLRGNELHEVEKHLVDCELCSEGLDGIRKMKEESRILTITHELHNLVRKRNIKRKKLFSKFDLITLFALVFIILFLIVAALMMFGKK